MRDERDSQSGDNLSRSLLLRLREKAIRKGVWFKALSQTERGVTNLTIRYVKDPRSHNLVGALFGIVKKLATAITSGFFYLLELAGRPALEERVNAALKWGNTNAKAWLHDKSFQRYLGLMTRVPQWNIGRPS